MSSKQFENAKSKLSSLKNEPGNDGKLKLYGLFKQATKGKCSTSKPGITDMVGRAKWNAWNQLGNMSKSEAELKYIEYVNELTGNVDQTDFAENKYQTIITETVFDNVFMIRFNRPDKLNALNGQMYKEVSMALKEAGANPNIIACCLTGNGKYFSSGNDLSSYLSLSGDNEVSLEDNIIAGLDICKNFIKSFIEFSKPLIALVNGPAVGVSFTILGLFDMIISSDQAKFSAPFTKIALSPEGCSSYTFPKLIGRMRAMEILIFNKNLSAEEALRYGLITELIEGNDFENQAMKKVEMISKLPKQSLIESRNCIRNLDKETLLSVNETEMEVLGNQFRSGEFMENVMAFMSKKSKL